MLIPILMIVFHEFRARFPKSLKLYLLACHTNSVVMNKPLLCINIMRKFDTKHLSKIDLISKHVNDFYLLAKLGFISADIKLKLFEKQETTLVKVSGREQGRLERTRSAVDECRDISIQHFINLDSLND
jgi:hypothetical protein